MRQSELIKAKNYAGCLLLQDNGIATDSEVLTCHVVNLTKERLVEKLGEITAEQLEQIRQGLVEILRYGKVILFKRFILQSFHATFYFLKHRRHLRPSHMHHARFAGFCEGHRLAVILHYYKSRYALKVFAVIGFDG